MLFVCTRFKSIPHDYIYFDNFMNLALGKSALVTLK